MLKTTAIQAGAFIDAHNKRLPEALGARPNIEVTPGDILLTCAGPRSRCGVPCLVRHTRPKLMMSGKMYRFRVPTYVNPALLEAWLLTAEAQSDIDRMKTGGSDSGLNLTHDRFRELEVVVPPTGEQHRIVEAIESYFTRLDDAVATLERVQRNLKRYRASVLQAAVEGRLVPTEAELARAEGRDYEPASVLLERILTERRRRWEQSGRRGKYQEPAAPDTSNLPDLPEGWCWATVEQLGTLASGQTPKGIEGLLTASGEVPWYRVGDMNTVGNESAMGNAKGWISRVQAAGLGLHTRPRGTIIFPKRGGAIATNKKRRLNVESAYDLNIMGVVPMGGVGDYLNLWFARIDLRLLSDGSNVPQINHGDIAPLAVALPPAAEQRRVISEADRLLTTADSVQTTSVATEFRCTRLRQSILKWAFEGNLADQDPNDEPASVLLERIKAERETGGSRRASSGRRGRRRAARTGAT